MSTDNSVEIAKSLGCSVIQWDTGNKTDEHKLRELKNTCWKTIPSGWIIMADMDEWLCVSEDELVKEASNDVTLLTIEGYDIIGESAHPALVDIDLHAIKKYNKNKYESKSLAFLREKVTDMNYHIGAHACNPTGIIKYSSSIYINKHMKCLGIQYLLNKIPTLYNRSHAMRSQHLDTHYTNNLEKIQNEYNLNLNRSSSL
jgi:hypothetical protein